jgi:hypothetical protein
MIVFSFCVITYRSSSNQQNPNPDQETLFKRD